VSVVIKNRDIVKGIYDIIIYIKILYKRSMIGQADTWGKLAQKKYYKPMIGWFIF
jgi:hypothetical protein